MVNSSQKAAKLYLVNKVRLMTMILSLQFVVGMILNTMGQPDSSTKHSINVLWHYILILHIIIGISLLAIAAVIVVFSVKHYKQLTVPMALAAVFIVLAIIFGSLTANHFHAELMSFFMALCFLATISVYGIALGKIADY